ncbi:MAG: ABC transporter substrate-binding protein [Bacteroidetes bacterium]|nr:MAG: ABC transporter substrate-binding protein [Bacteroidota bacterium]
MNSRIYIGLDDTDNDESRGTGHLARALAQSLIHTGLVNVRWITRHQLLVDPAIPYTSHNSAACLAGQITGNEYWVRNYCSDFLLGHAAPGSDAGLCIAFEEEIDKAVIRFGEQAKQQVLTRTSAESLARRCDLFLTGLTGKKIGVIGALAAVGLRRGGNDGRLLWMEKLREIQGVFTVKKYKELVAIDLLVDLQGNALPEDASIRITDWCRPVVRNKKIVLFAEKLNGHDSCEYQSASKEYIKYISE